MRIEKPEINTSKTGNNRPKIGTMILTVFTNTPLSIISKGGKYGLEQGNKIILPCEYDSCEILECGYIETAKGDVQNLYKIVDGECTLVSDMKFLHIDELEGAKGVFKVLYLGTSELAYKYMIERNNKLVNALEGDYEIDDKINRNKSLGLFILKKDGKYGIECRDKEQKNFTHAKDYIYDDITQDNGNITLHQNGTQPITCNVVKMVQNVQSTLAPYKNIGNY